MLRTCKKCGVEKDLSLFVKSKKCKLGYCYTCKKCNSILYYDPEEQKEKRDRNPRKSTKNYSKGYRDNLSSSYIKTLLKKAKLPVTLETIEAYRDKLKEKRVNKGIVPPLRTCKRCLSVKKINSFTLDKKCYGGRTHLCRECANKDALKNAIKSSANLNDRYIKSLLRQSGINTIDKEIIEQKRITVKIKRVINEKSRKINPQRSNDNPLR